MTHVILRHAFHYSPSCKVGKLSSVINCAFCVAEHFDKFTIGKEGRRSYIQNLNFIRSIYDLFSSHKFRFECTGNSFFAELFLAMTFMLCPIGRLYIVVNEGKNQNGQMLTEECHLDSGPAIARKFLRNCGSQCESYEIKLNIE